MIVSIAVEQNKYWLSQSNSTRKELGQYFTGEAIADFMSSMATPFFETSEHIKILDAGAGAGILSSALALRCLNIGHLKVHAVLYEIDEKIVFQLKKNMQEVCTIFKEVGGKFSYEIRLEDFVLSRPDKNNERFHYSSINPPYFKYKTKVSPYSNATSDIYKGNPNIYVQFLAIINECLFPNGQMIGIVPRSFANGLYFKGFRNYLTANSSIDHIHIFRSRNRAFKKSSVLQENVIIKSSKGLQSDVIDISSSQGADDLSRLEHNTYQHDLIIDKSNDHEMIRIPENASESEVLSFVESWPTTFEKSGFFISTGRVVEHRTKSLITLRCDKNTVPLLRMHNIKALKTIWTGTHKKDAYFKLCDASEKHLIDNSNYIFLKRFSSKDERRRLVAGLLFKRNWPYQQIALENHLNYIGKSGGMTSHESYGLAGLFNSTFMDIYFRCVSGNTQVNATEIRLLKLPSNDSLISIGKRLYQKKDLTQEKIDKVISKVLGV